MRSLIYWSDALNNTDTHSTHPTRRRVIKVGGSLFSDPNTPNLLRQWLDAHDDKQNILIGGGGTLVDSIRQWESEGKLNTEEAHWMAIQCMTLTADLLKRWLNVPLLCQPSHIAHTPNNSVVVMDVHNWLRQESDMPVGWSLTSDSIAAALADRLQAEELILLKPCSPPSGTTSLRTLSDAGYVDRLFCQYGERIESVGFVDFLSPTPDILFLSTMGSAVS